MALVTRLWKAGSRISPLHNHNNPKTRALASWQPPPMQGWGLDRFARLDGRAHRPTDMAATSRDYRAGPRSKTGPESRRSREQARGTRHIRRRISSSKPPSRTLSGGALPPQDRARDGDPAGKIQSGDLGFSKEKGE
ncbi:hypothetical protein B2J93_564 [Marssonina coronariae]|uniref:Uncharacterized protein n=1 Tax=Diplocarpon coronariae TaxID=2795749 RepID=A0A218Z044_9HELO|nr:hypothetical protein B2J93_564 [Marssonina coronariae]